MKYSWNYDAHNYKPRGKVLISTDVDLDPLSSQPVPDTLYVCSQWHWNVSVIQVSGNSNNLDLIWLECNPRLLTLY